MPLNFGRIEVRNTGDRIGFAVVLNLVPDQKESGAFHDVRHRYLQEMPERYIADVLDASPKVKALRDVEKRIGELEKTRAALDRQAQRLALDRTDVLANVSGDKLVTKLADLDRVRTELEQKIQSYESAMAALRGQRSMAQEPAQAVARQAGMGASNVASGEAAGRLEALKGLFLDSVKGFLIDLAALDQCLLQLRRSAPLEDKAAQLLAERVASAGK
jgi:hypothetical protein